MARAKRSASALRKVHTKVPDDGTPVHSFSTLLKALSNIVRNVCRPRRAGPEAPTSEIATTPTPTHGHSGSPPRSEVGRAIQMISTFELGRDRPTQ